MTEGQFAVSKADFHAKNAIALKEAAESEYWISLLFKADYLLRKEYESLMADLLPIIKILTKIVKNSDE